MEINKLPNGNSTLVLTLSYTECELLRKFVETAQHRETMGLMNEVYGNIEDTVTLGIMLQQIERNLR
jgi:hypothetical protein